MGRPDAEAEVTKATKLPSEVSGEGAEAKVETATATGYGCGMHGDTAAKQVS